MPCFFLRVCDETDRLCLMTTITAGKDVLDITNARQGTRPGSIRRKTPVTVCPVKCFACLSINHTQKSCPLRMCAACGMYSHSAHQCMSPSGPYRPTHRGGLVRVRAAAVADTGARATAAAAAAAADAPRPPRASLVADAGRWMVNLAALPAYVEPVFDGRGESIGDGSSDGTMSGRRDDTMSYSCDGEL